MAKNHVAEVAKMLGLEMGEEFEVDTGNDSRILGWCDRNRQRYRFTDHGFQKVQAEIDISRPFVNFGDSYEVLNTYAAFRHG